MLTDFFKEVFYSSSSQPFFSCGPFSALKEILGTHNL